MQALEKNKGVLGLSILLLAGIFAYQSFSGGSTGVSSGAPSAASVGADLIKVSDNLSRATLSRELFSASGYRLLSDFSKALETEPLGRTNPFAPIGQ